MEFINGKANEKMVIKGNKYRISILSERLIRLEYNENGEFEDLSTEFAWNRDFDECKYEIRQDSKFLEITTSYFKLTYVKERCFQGSKISPTSNLKVEVLNSEAVYIFLV